MIFSCLPWLYFEKITKISIALVNKWWVSYYFILNVIWQETISIVLITVCLSVLSVIDRCVTDRHTNLKYRRVFLRKLITGVYLGTYHINKKKLLVVVETIVWIEHVEKWFDSENRGPVEVPVLVLVHVCPWSLLKVARQYVLVHVTAVLQAQIRRRRHIAVGHFCELQNFIWQKNLQEKRWKILNLLL